MTASLRPGRTWWAFFAIFVGLPAVLLAVLGLRAARMERLEHEQQVRDQHAQLARLADSAISNALGGLETQGPLHAPAVYLAGAVPFVLDTRGTLLFPRDRLYFAEFGVRPAVAPAPPARAVIELIEQAQSAEAQRRAGEAETLYRRVARADGRLRAWTELAQARIQLARGEAPALGVLADAAWARADGISPSGLPVALAACGYAAAVDAADRPRFRPLLKLALERLRRGDWWMSYEERRFYDEELQRSIAAQEPMHFDGRTGGKSEAPGKADQAAGEDERIEALARMERAVRRSLPYYREGTSRSYVEEDGEPVLVVWVVSGASEKRDRAGAAFPRQALPSLIQNAIGPLLAGQALKATIRDTNGQVLWSNAADENPSGHNDTSVPLAGVIRPRAGTGSGMGRWVAGSAAVPLRAMPRWEIELTRPVGDPLSRTRLLWYGFTGLLVAMLMLGVAMTARIIHREAELGRLQADFLAAVTHEFKSPITSIRLLAERIAAGRVRTEAAVTEYGRTIQQETERLERLVNRLLQSHKLQSGEQRDQPRAASLTELADACITRFRALAGARGITLQLRTAGPVPPIDVDEQGISDVLDNLLDNALKYSPPGKTVSVTIAAAGGDVQMDVCDEGIGIEPGELPHIFDRFYRGHRGDQHNVQGTGLGLALVKAAVEAHGGRVEASSVVGAGSRFTVRLPIRPPQPTGKGRKQAWAGS